MRPAFAVIMEKDARALRGARPMRCAAGGGRGAARRAQDAKLNAGGLLGGCTLEYLRLAAVLQAGEPELSLLRGIWFGLW